MNEDLLLGDHEQLWFTLDNNDGTLFDSGATRSPLNSIRNIELNGMIYNDVIDVISTEVNNDLEETVFYLQRNTGLVAYELAGETWTLR